MMRMLSISVFILLAGVICAQQHQCGFDHYAKQLHSDHPDMDEKKNRILERDTESTFRSTADVYTIRTVVHLVENGSKPPITDQRVEDAITVLNEDFRRINADTINLRPIFQDVVGDPGIEFELTEIVRVSTDTLFEFGLTSLPDYVKQSVNGGSDAVDPAHYMNIWVCTVEGGALLGYAYPPEGLPNWPAGSNAPASELDGVVIHDDAFEAFGQLSFNNMIMELRGRTLTHEVGHYLGLRHIWGDGLLPIFGIPNCTDDDGVDDTPMQGLQSPFDCDTTLNTCMTPADLPDMIENHMDYSSEVCKNSFTKGQILIMRGVLENERVSLLDQISSSLDQTNELDIVVYPNPVSDLMTIKNESDENVSVVLLNLNGQRLHSLQMVGREALDLKMDQFQIVDGLYLLHFIGRNGSMTERVFYKK